MEMTMHQKRCDCFMGEAPTTIHTVYAEGSVAECAGCDSTWSAFDGRDGTWLQLCRDEIVLADLARRGKVNRFGDAREVA